MLSWVQVPARGLLLHFFWILTAEISFPQEETDVSPRDEGIKQASGGGQDVWTFWVYPPRGRPWAYPRPGWEITSFSWFRLPRVPPKDLDVAVESSESNGEIVVNSKNRKLYQPVAIDLDYVHSQARSVVSTFYVKNYTWLCFFFRGGVLWNVVVFWTSGPPYKNNKGLFSRLYWAEYVTLSLSEDCDAPVMVLCSGFHQFSSCTLIFFASCFILLTLQSVVFTSVWFSLVSLVQCQNIECSCFPVSLGRLFLR